MKRKIKILGLSGLVSFLGFILVNSAASGGVGFGIAVIIGYFFAVVCLVVNCVFTIKLYRIMKSFCDELR